jgi:hypothetical protein
MDAQPASCAALQRGAGRSFEQVPRRLQPVSKMPTSSARSIVSGLAGAGHRETDRDARSPKSGELAEQFCVVEDAALDRGGVDLIRG